MRILRWLLAAFALASVSVAAQAEERILRFVSDVQIRKDASLDVTETIDVRAEQNAINHGIFRDFPTRYKGPHGSQVRVGFEFQNATLDGDPVRATTEAVRNGVRIKLGDPDTLVDVGEHRYVLHYRTTRQVGRFKDFDELYWNATGNGWQFPIDLAEARIRLPEAAKFGQRSTYTGPQGSTSSNAVVSEERPGEIAFRTTTALNPHEGLTVAVAFPKGVIAAPSESERTRWWLADCGPPIVGVLSLLGLCVFYYFAWARAGRNPRAGTVVPLFSPPDQLTPAAMRYVTKMGADNRAFAAALVDMGVRGHIRLVEEEGGFFSRDKTRIERSEGAEPLSAEEAAALDKLCAPGESIMMVQKEHEKFSSAQKALSDHLKEAYEGKLFNRNWGWAVAGLILFAAALWVTAAAITAATGGASAWTILITLGCIAVAAMLAPLIHDASSTGKCLLIVGMLIAGGLAFASGMPVFFEALNSGWMLPLLFPALGLALVIPAFWWIAAPTKEGRGVLDRIAGFKQYLSITEQERLDRMHPPEEDTPQLFERYLPYAIALGVENRWAERFAGVLAAAAAQGQQGFGWYSGHSDPWNNPGRFAESVGSSLSSTVSSASTAPGSSSGSGGGGSSGGGGGGGGGGGW